MSRPKKHAASEWIGKTSGSRLFLESLGTNEVHQDIVKWQCTSCGNVGISRLNRMIDKPRKCCDRCIGAYIGTGTEHFSGAYFASLRHGASKRKYSFEITPEDCERQFQKQNGLCFFTGQPLYGDRSVDRFDNTKGYLPSNIVIVIKEINSMKSTLTPDRFIELCKLVAENQ